MKSFIELCTWIKEFEQDSQIFVNRDYAAAYFGFLESCLGNSTKAQGAQAELALIQALFEHILHSRGRQDQEIPEDLLEDIEDDSQVVEELRGILQVLAEARQGAA